MSDNQWVGGEESQWADKESQWSGEINSTSYSIFINRYGFRSINREIIYGYELLENSKFRLAGNSQFILPKAGKILGINVLCESSDYTISLRSRNGIVFPSVEEILRVVNINKEYKAFDLNILYYNADDENYLYLYVCDNGNPTGIIYLNLIISGM